MTQSFTKSLELNRQFYVQVVRPILHKHFPNLIHSAALIGQGSEILGYDDLMSTDHDWGPRLQLFLQPDVYIAHHKAILDILAHQLPYTFGGFSTHFSPPDPADNGTQPLHECVQRPINHRITVHTVRGFVHDFLNYDINEPLESADWLSFSQQHLLGLTAGRVFHDGVDLTSTRSRFAYYPDDIWLYLLAAGWQRISQEEHLMGRAGYAGDELGSALIAARLVRDIMQLCFLMSRRYAPYAKWFGTAFRELGCADELESILRMVLSAESWQQREKYLTVAYQCLAEMHNALQITVPLATNVTSFFNRPFQVITTNGILPAIIAQIEDEDVRQLATRPLIGSLDQFSDNTDLVSYVRWRPTLRQLYTA